MAEQIQIPEGFVMNAAGHLVPKHQVREQDALRDQVAGDLGQVRVVQVDEEKVTLDANHPLAGQDLEFEIELLSVE